MGCDFLPNQKKVIGNHIKRLLAENGLSQAKIGREHKCSATAVNIAVWQLDPLHIKLVNLKEYIAQRLGRPSWQELCEEALQVEQKTNEEVTA